MMEIIEVKKSKVESLALWFKNRRSAKWIVAFVGILAFGYLFTQDKASDIPVEKGEVGEVIVHSVDMPDEEVPGDDYEWVGAPGDPKFITMPTIDSAGYIQKVGIDQRNEIAVPTNVHIAGWFVDSVRPGERGLSIIDGHLDGLRSPALFHRLGELKLGDRFQVEFGDGSVKHFEVTATMVVSEEDSVNFLFSQNPGTTNQLNLITCTGNFDSATRRYDERIIVSSKAL